MRSSLRKEKWKFLLSSDGNFSSNPALMRETAAVQNFGYEEWKFDDMHDVTNQYRTNASQFLVEMVFRWRWIQHVWMMEKDGWWCIQFLHQILRSSVLQIFEEMLIIRHMVWALWCIIKNFSLKRFQRLHSAMCEVSFSKDPSQYPPSLLINKIKFTCYLLYHLRQEKSCLKIRNDPLMSVQYKIHTTLMLWLISHC